MHRKDAGRIISLDEAHKFITATSPEANGLTGTMLSIVHQQRHLGTRVVIATQEPTVSSKLLDATTSKATSDLFRQITSPPTGEALDFCPPALLDTAKYGSEYQDGVSELEMMVDGEETSSYQNTAIQLGPKHA
ncbi:hypothetical protein N7474_002805 [Penicillium riverlandense]|uniref:uncharacterized protein n=1 Tax=Penicillium riverlandense TaxID=1903569 RepID=UPI002548F393|nr:uncharacterized protein N7474_002805 [Penicillium riverlandense]KAJ5825667.1 hypothetical protein N7474_002805 [Penicillium riverlandense]